jgi:8-oxo-dGTP diphosphatase
MSMVVHVAVGVLVDTEGRVLIARRAPTSHQGGLWEFPGGKVEAHETAIDALRRELTEELGVSVQSASPLMQVDHEYRDKAVLLDVHRVTEWADEPRSCEGQPLAWVLPSKLDEFQFPEANEAIVSRLQSGSLDE